MAPSPSPIDSNPATPASNLDPHSNPNPTPTRSLIGHPPNHWLHTPHPPTFDLTRPPPPHFPPPPPSTSLTISTSTSTIILSPPLTALLIIDLQNFFLSPSLGHSPSSAGNLAASRLLSTAIPAARNAGIRIVWLNWGLTEHEVTTMPPSTKRAFGFELSPDREAAMEEKQAAEDPHGVNQTAVESAATLWAATTKKKKKKKKKKNNEQKPSSESESAGNEIEIGDDKPAPRIFKGLGSSIGPVTLSTGSVIDAGPLLMRDTWNASLPSQLMEAYDEGAKMEVKPDVWVHKNRMSGLWGAGTACTEFLEGEGITTLLFAGVNTDQCVSGSLEDAFSRGYDCVLLRDGCGTTSPKAAREGIEYNCERTWGFVADCEGLREGVEGMLEARRMGK